MKPFLPLPGLWMQKMKIPASIPARVAQYSLMIARELGFDEQSCEELKRAALLHDIGKIGIPDSILNKPARLTDEE